MKKRIVAMLCIVALVGAISSFLATSYAMGRLGTRTTGTLPVDINSIQSITKTNGVYNISIRFLSYAEMAETYAFPATYNSSRISHTVQNFGINGIAQEEIPCLAIYLNGTAQDVSSPLRYDRCVNDSLQVNLLLPCKGYPSGSTIDICAWGGENGEGMWGQSVKLP